MSAIIRAGTLVGSEEMTGDQMVAGCLQPSHRSIPLDPTGSTQDGTQTEG
jgi:hypothetical protein